MSSSSSADVSIDPARYPSPRKDDCVIDDYHGIKISDPYRWMEDPDAEETKAFVDQLNDLSRPFVEACDVREQLREKLTKLWDYEKFSCSSKRGKYYYYKHNSGLQNQFVHYQQDSLCGVGRVFLDPNTLSSDGTTAVNMAAWTHDGSIYAYGLSEKGSDWVTLKFRTAEGVDLPDSVPKVKHSSLAWTGDNSGVFYSTYPSHKGEACGTSVEKTEFHSLFFHRLGTSACDDVLVYQFAKNPEFMVSGHVSDDGRFLVLDASRGCDPFNKVFYFDLAAAKNSVTGEVAAVPLFDKLDAKYDFIDNDAEWMYFRTNKDAPMFKLIRVKIGSTADSESAIRAETLIEESEKRVLSWAAPLLGGRLLVAFVEDVKEHLYMYEQATGRQLYQIPLPIGTVSAVFAEKDQPEVFFTFESHLIPMIEYRIDLAGLPLEKEPVLQETRRTTLPGINPDDFKVEQAFFSSKDGTKVPMYIISSASLVRDGNNPTFLYGYGGFNVPDMPSFSISRLLWIKYLGGVYATANLRGGSEYGEKWHEGGMREKKQNVFDDFIAAAEFLIQSGITRPAKLAIHGGSNGGLLVGACAQQRPELYGCVINRVGVLDMLRFHKFTIGGAWVPEFGDPDVKEDFEFIYKYSPLHNIRFPESGEWPATYLMTADHDDRVVPSHTLKYIATLYEKAKQHKGQSKPILARVEVKAGHGAGKPTSKIIAETVDLYAFTQRVLDAPWKE